VPDNERARYTFDDFTVDLARAELLHCGKQVSLRPKSFDALRYLIESRGRLATKDELVQALWPRTIVTEDSLVKCIQDVRAALHDDGHRYIKTVPRRGYMFDSPVSLERAAPEREPALGTKSAASIDLGKPPDGDRLAAAETNPKHEPTLGIDAGPRGGRRRLAAWIVGAAAIASVVTLGMLLLRREQTAEPPVLRRSIAVLPLENLSPDPEHEYFAAGIHESILNQLAQIEDVKTISRTSMLRYAATERSTREIARELNVQTVMEGSVRYADGRVLVTAQLIDPVTDTHLWSEEYYRPLADIFAIQTDIAQRIAAALNVELSVADRSRLATVPTRSPEAYQLYLRGRYHWDRWTIGEASRSVEYFEQAIRHDPEFALAYAGLADAFAALDGLAGAPPAELMPKADAAVSRALQIDPALPEAYIARAMIKHFYTWDYAGGNADFEHAIALNPDSAAAHHLYGKNLPVTGEFAKAFAEFERALQLEPYSNGINKDLGETLYYARRYEEAIAQFRRTEELEPNSPPVYFFLTRCYEAIGAWDQSIDANLHRLRLPVTTSDGRPLGTTLVDELEQIYRVSGWQGYWRRRLELLNEAAAQGYVEPYRFVEIYVRLGEHDPAFAWLETAFKLRSSWIPTIAFDPVLDPLRADPRFTDLLRRAGLH
jgi:TolB-like protein/DNA-binding winged helix-turn-helix (wHTH) protein/Tfp pilus assembly protein PilF